MSCHRCHGLMYPEDLLIGASGSGHDRVCGWRCVSCGDVVEQGDRSESYACKGPVIRQTRKEASPTGSHDSGFFMAGVWGIQRESG